MSRSEVDLREVQDMLPDTVRDMAGRIGLPATLVVVEQLGGTSWRIAEGRARRAKRAGLRWPSWWAATSRSSSTRTIGAKKFTWLAATRRWYGGATWRSSSASNRACVMGKPPVACLAIWPASTTCPTAGYGRLSTGRASRHRSNPPCSTKPGRNAPAGVSAPILSQPLNPFR